VVDEVEHPICFYSKKLDCHQKRYSTIEKEALALVLAVRMFSVYFGTQPVKVFTDHSPLQFIQRMANHNQKVLRWSLELQQYSLEICHRVSVHLMTAIMLGIAMHSSSLDKICLQIATPCCPLCKTDWNTFSKMANSQLMGHGYALE